MKSLKARITCGELLLVDGGLGTQLLERGLKAGDCPEFLNLSHPELVEEVARLYFEAGADLVSTNTFGGSPLELAAYHLDGKVAEINRNAVRTVRKVVGSQASIFASCGPSGRLLKPYGDVDPDAVYESFRTQMEVLVSAGADLLGIETMTDLAEAVLAVKAARAVSGVIPVSATVTFERTRRGFFTIMGNNVEKVVGELREAGADILGSNCGNGSDDMVALAREMRQATGLPLLIQPNAGLPQLLDGRLYYPESPGYMAQRVQELLDLGVSLVGGCCGTTPKHTRAFRAVVDGRKASAG